MLPEIYAVFILICLTAAFHVYGYVAGIFITILCIVRNKTISGKSYIYPLIPFNYKQFMSAVLPDQPSLFGKSKIVINSVDKTISGESYIYPLIPFNYKQFMRRFCWISLPHSEKVK